MTRIGRLLALLIMLPASTGARPIQDHPRLWITAESVAQLRTWARSDNPVYAEGLRALANAAVEDMDSGEIPDADNGGSTYSAVNTEAYAALFAFLALVDPDPAARGDWAERSHTLLFHMLDAVDACMRSVPPVATGPFCSDAFPVSDRSRWQGAALPLAVDWLGAATLPDGAPALSAADKAEIRRVFIWWSYLNREAYPNPYNNPPQDSVPVGTTGDPLLRLDDPRHYRLRFSGNNYFAGHMRQLGMMSIALDRDDDRLDPLAPATYLRRNASGNLQEYPFDDANGRLGGFLGEALDAWLYMQDYLLRHDARGGLPTEGMEYAPTSLGIPAQLLLALDTAGYGDADSMAQHGARVASLDTNPFYRAIVSGYVHSLSPIPFDNPDRGLVYWPAWYGDGEFYYQADSMNILGPLALHAARVGDARTVDTVRWIERHVPPGGSDAMLSRARNAEDILETLMYFLVFDPDAASSQPDAPDPRGGYPLSFWAEGHGRLLSRTSWSPSARWFDFKLGWDTVDHQHGDGLMIELYRNGEWLTKGALGYGLEGGATDYKNSIAVENTIWNGIDPESARARRLVRGSQMPQNGASGDPAILARSEHDAYSYVTGDATPLYNAWYDKHDPTPEAERADDVEHVSRSVLWIKPDLVVAYDRARTTTAGRYKRLWLNMPDRLPSVPTIAGSRATGTTPGGQHLFVTSVLPASKTLAIVTSDPEINLDRGNLWSLGDEDPILQRRPYVDPETGLPVPETFENYATRLRIDASGGPSDVRFLTVLEGADAGAAATPATPLAADAASGCGVWEGVVVGSSAILFPRDVGATSDCIEYTAPPSATRHFIAGLTPWGAYDWTTTQEGASVHIRLSAGGAARADEGGLLRFEPGSAPTPTPLLVISGDALSADELPFGAVIVGEQRTLAVQLSNRGGAPLTIASITLEPGAGAAFELSGPCTEPSLVLEPDSGCELDATFAPATPGFAEASLEIATDSITAPPSITLVGAGFVPRADSIFSDGFEAGD